VGATREGVVEDGSGDGGIGEVADVLPTEGEASAGGIRGFQSVGGVLGVGLAGEADAGKALGENDAARRVVPGVGLVRTEDGELDAVDSEEFVEGEAEGHGGEDVNLDEGLTASGACRAAREPTEAHRICPDRIWRSRIKRKNPGDGQNSGK